MEVSIRADLCCDSVYSYLKLRASQPVAWSALMQYDNVGRPAHQRVRHNGRTLLDKSYLWGDNLRLLQTLDTINRRSVRYDYDTFGSLSGAVYGDGSCQWRNPDAMGNVYDSPDRTDRSYGRGGQLREDKKWRYYYDSHGNLVLKTMRRSGPSLETGMRDEFLAWQSGDYAYTWQGNGMLRSVTRPDGKTVTFKYDALGRRIEKVFDGRVYRYLWDGDVIIHEWEYAEADRPNTVVTETGEGTLDRPEPVENLITWVYEEGSYVPVAKLQNGERYTIISDYMGRPVEAYKSYGTVVWQADYDIYGDLRNIKGIRDFIPFRQLGQYEDDETRLYYNRFRYYDPRIGNYISQDPIGLMGNNPTLYGYVGDCNIWSDVFGLDFKTVDFSGHPDLYQGLGKNTVKIKMQGSRGRDFTEAYKEAGISGEIKKQVDSEYTWHHVADFNPETGECTMQLVKTETHIASLPHKGAVSQFEKEFGVEYSKKGGAVDDSKSKGWLSCK